jgi:hypothetical protein
MTSLVSLLQWTIHETLVQILLGPMRVLGAIARSSRAFAQQSIRERVVLLSHGICREASLLPTTNSIPYTMAFALK